MTSVTGKIATIVDADGAAIQALFAASVVRWRNAGANIVGVIGEAHGLPDRTCSAGLLRDIASGKPFSIYLEKAPSHTSCHLDATGVEAACAEVIHQVPASDLVVLSKFGKLEAMQSGLTHAFKAAIAAGKPVLTTVSDKHREAWEAFAPDAIYLRADEEALQSWWRAQAPVRNLPGVTIDPGGV
jgi:nucleoside-triphosphatase THEP1